MVIKLYGYNQHLAMFLMANSLTQMAQLRSLLITFKYCIMTHTFFYSVFTKIAECLGAGMKWQALSEFPTFNYCGPPQI